MLLPIGPGSQDRTLRKGSIGTLTGLVRVTLHKRLVDGQSHTLKMDQPKPGAEDRNSPGPNGAASNPQTRGSEPVILLNL